MAKAVGILEVFGLTTAFVAADAGCKAADVTIERFDKNKPANADSLPVPLIVAIKFRGDVAEVEAAEAAATETAKAMAGGGGRCGSPHPERPTEKMLKLSGLDKS